MSKPVNENTIINVSSDSPEDLIRILSLAGVKSDAPEEPAASSCSVCGTSDHSEDSCPNMMSMDGEVEEQADFDNGEQDNEPAGHEVDPNTYVWQGPRTPQRLVKGFAGDNPLVHEFHKKIVSKYEEYLLEADNRENAEGNESPLTNPTKPEFDKDPLSGETPVDDGSNSPMSTIVRQPVLDE